MTATPATRIRPGHLALLALVCALVLPALAGAAAPASFDHFTTGFELVGEHRIVPCADCHVGGIFKGTPTDCFACHASGSRIGASSKPVSHILSNNACADCHTAFGWKPVAHFTHLDVIGSCNSCHNGVQSIGKTPNHIPTTAECSSCHNVMQTFRSAKAMPGNHIPYATTAACSDCHTSSDFAVLPTFTNIHRYAPSTSTNCAQCHGSQAAFYAIPAIKFAIVGLPSNHIPTTAACEGCHVGAGSSIAATPVVDGATFKNSLISHTGLNTCDGCHGPKITGASFIGVTSIVVMPPASAPGAGSHIPSSTACEVCHATSAPPGLIAASSTRTAPGTLFATPIPTTQMIHSGITSGCNACHEAGYVWMDMASYPISPTAYNSDPATQYFGFQVRPGTSASTYAVADAAHPTTGDCSKCHSGTTYFSGTLKPPNHIPYAATATCDKCHTSTDFSVLPTLTNVHAYAPSTSTNCAQCHGAAAASFAIPAAKFAIVSTPTSPKHITPNTSACESCHVGTGSSIAATPVMDGATFKNSAMSHVGQTTCVGCHGANVTASSFFGISKIVVMPPTSPVGAGSHIPYAASVGCETCHAGSMPAGLVPANAAVTAPGSLFATPVPTTQMIHTSISNNCNACHEGGNVWMDVSKYPLQPATVSGSATTQYLGFNTRPGVAASTYVLLDKAHPTSGDCSACHGSTDYFEAAPKPANHIPYAAAAQCNACHTSTDFSVKPTLANIHANAQSTSANCTQCHGSKAGYYAIPAASFTITPMPGNHITLPSTDPACETCHVGAGSSVASTPVVDGATFANSKMSHTGLTGCVGCHGPTISGASFKGVTAIVVMPPTAPAGAGSHIPSSTSCETCHAASAPAGLIAASATKSAPGTLFAMPVPTTQLIHTGITANCNACHEGGNVWMGMASYPLSPTAVTGSATTQYLGFNTRPGASASTYVLKDAAHPTGQDCSACHGSTDYFEATPMPANHIPFAAAAQCSSCHTGSDFSVIPTMTAIHANAQSTSANCTQCHGSKAAYYAIPAAKFTITPMPGNHITLPSADPACETCHVGAGSSVASTPVVTGAKFTNSKMNHAGLTTCVGCHGPTVTGATFMGVTGIVVMPQTTPAGAGSHIPSSTSCETCHAGSAPMGLIAASVTKTAPGTLFAMPVPTTAMIHTGITANCNACHEGGNVWMGMPSYPLSPNAVTGSSTTQYLGFNTRPGATASSYVLKDAAHPNSGDCSGCHSSTAYFDGGVKPANHIPYAVTATCTNCHTTTTYSVLPTLAAIHQYAQSTTSNCTQCHGSQAGYYAIPAASFSIVGLPANHVPTIGGTKDPACESCHVGAGSSVAATPVPNGAKFTNSLMSHAGYTTCDQCHGQAISGASFMGVTKIIVMPKTSPAGASSHVPYSSSVGCEVCHAGSAPAGLIAANTTKATPGSLFATPVPTTAMIHTGISNNCNSCHEGGYVWMDMASYPLAPNTVSGSTTTQYLGFNTRPAATASTYVLKDAAHPASGDCSACHTGTAFFSANVKPANHIPYAAAAACTACHTSTDFSVMPTFTAIHANAQSTTTNCIQCHGSAAASFAIPAASFSIVSTPTNPQHVTPNTAACETCHVGAGSSMASLPVVNGATFKNSAMSHSGYTTCVSCHGATVTATTFYGISKIVVLPPTSPAGAAAHIPYPTTLGCEVCHAGSTPAGLVPGNATKVAPGTAFATPVPTTAQIHTNVTSGCAACHEKNDVWMDMGNYPISPKTVSGSASTQYLGFNTRPGATGGTYQLVDAPHPASGDCSACHSRTDYFDGVIKPTNHIPYATTAVCTNCHTNADFSVMPTLANIHLYAPSTTANCTSCHGSQAAFYAIPAANFTIVGLPAKHVTPAADQACESCHVGAGSSIAATPVPNGAKWTNSKFSHSGITTCLSCHGPTVTNTSFIGVTKIIVMPPTSPAGAGSHIPYPASVGCEVCHAGSAPAGLVAASATLSTPGSLFATPVPTTAQIHTSITAGCAGCHEAGYVWMDMAKYPLVPATLSSVATTQYLGFDTRPGPAASTYVIKDAAHPSSGDCVGCHTRTDYWEGQLKPANHIPYAAAAACTACHTSTDFSVMPTFTAIHANAQSTTTNCIQCHGSAAASFAILAANFSIVSTPAKHVVANTQACETCHVGAGSSMATLPVVNGATFKNSMMSHTGIVNGCNTCHGPAITSASFFGITRITVLPATTPAGAATAHIPTSADCSVCHAHGAAMVPANAVVLTPPGTNWVNPVPTTAQIHGTISSGCNACHEAGYLWLDAAKYPISPTSQQASSTTQYIGFNTRPLAAASTYSVADSAHPSSGDCSACHTGTAFFTAAVKPSNHIPYAATATCDNCHTATPYSVSPSIANIHLYAQSTTTNCIQCHGSAAATFSISAANFSIVGYPNNHATLPSADTPCETCHVGTGSSIAATPVPNGAKWTNSKFSHTGLTNCISCHGPTITASSFVGITKIVVMPPSASATASSHIPSGTTDCDACHAGSVPAGLIAANATKTTGPGTLFATPVPTTAQIHTGISTGCNACHEKNYVWIGMTYYPIAPTTVSGSGSTQYTGFNTRPGTAGTFQLLDTAHPASGDCGGCHTGTTYFSAQAEPAGHIPTTPGAACSVCHTTAGDFTKYTTNYPTLHTAVGTDCHTCHADTAPNYTGVTGFTIVKMSTKGKHIPITYSGGTAECSGCHKVFTAFSGTIMSHLAVGDSGSSAAGAACDACHEWGMRNMWFGLNTWQRDSATHYYCAPGGTTICSKGGADCTTGCHQHQVSSKYAGVGSSSRKTIQSSSKPTTPGAAPTPRTGSTAKPGVPPRKTAMGGVIGVPGHVDHTTLTGTCFSCHNGVNATAKPVGHPPAGSDCDRCHTTSAWKPAVYDHATVLPGTCASCHNALAAIAKPAGHVVTQLTCDSCHYTLAWTPTKTLKQARPAARPPVKRPTTPSVPRTNSAGQSPSVP